MLYSTDFKIEEYIFTSIKFMRTSMICVSSSKFWPIWSSGFPWTKRKKGDSVCNGVVIFVNMELKSFKGKIVIYIFF